MEILNSLVKVPPIQGTVTKSKPNGEPDIGLIKFFYPNFKLISGVEYFTDYDGVIFIVNSSNMSIASKIKEMGVPYILVSDSCEVDLTDRTTLLEFIFSHHNKKVPKYLDEIKDVLDYGTFYELVKIYWVSGSWVLKEYNPANAFIEFIDSFNTIKKSEFIGKVINLMDICPVKVLESMLLSFLLKVNNPDTPIKGSYGKAILSFRKNKHIPVDEAVLKSLSSPVDNEYLRLFNFIVSLKY